MQIPEIRARLPLSRVLNHYQLKPDARGRMRCPFHDDRTASMQTYEETGTVYCFAGSCPTHGRSLDVIDFIKEREGCSKHEAILKAKELAGDLPKAVPLPMPSSNRELADDAARSAVLAKVWASMRSGVAMSTVAKGYLERRGLDYKLLDAAGAAVGYNSGQMHYGERRDEALIASCLRYGLLSESGRKSRTGEPAYRTFAKGCVAFALKTESGQVGGLCFRNVNDKGGKHFYLRDRRGLWPSWPVAETKRVLLCESVIDAASVVQDEAIRKDWSVLALYGTNGWAVEHTAALGKLKKLEEVCLMLDGDNAGRQATEAYANKVRESWPGVRVTRVELPEGEDANGVLVASGAEVLRGLIEKRVEAVVHAEVASTTLRTGFASNGAAASEMKPTQKAESAGKLDESNPYDLGYGGRAARYRVKGYRLGQLDTLKVTLQIAKA